MSRWPEHSLGCNCLGRRHFLKMASGAALVGSSGGTAFLIEQARADALAKELRDTLTAPQVIGLLAKIKPAIEATTYSGERSAKNSGFVDAVARKNVELTVAGIRNDSPILAELELQGAIKTTGAMYNLETGAVEFFE
jgi:carbonic anhydrase